MSVQTMTPRPGEELWCQPVQLVVRLLPVGMAAMLAVDHLLGDRAEYFHAGRLLGAWASALRGGGIDDHHFIVGQEGMNDAAALFAGSAVFVLEPALVLTVVVFGGARAARFLRARRG